MSRDGDRRDGEVAPVEPAPPDAAAYLRNYAIHAEPREVGVAIAVLLDHIARLEQTLTLIRSGHESAMRHMPEFAVIDAGKTRG